MRAPGPTGADDGDPVSGARRTIPEAVYRRFHVGGECRAPVRHIIGDDDDGILRDDEPVLMGMEAEDAAAAKFRGTVLDNSGDRIAVFDGPGEFPLLERATHALPFTLRHFPAKDERFGAPTDGARARPDQQLAQC